MELLDLRLTRDQWMVISRALLDRATIMRRQSLSCVLCHAEADECKRIMVTVDGHVEAAIPVPAMAA